MLTPQEIPLPDEAAPPQAFGINLIGSIFGGIGLSAATRAIASLLKSKGIPFSIYDVPFGWVSQQSDPEFESHLVSKPDDLIHPVNLYVLSITYFQSFINENPEFFSSQRLHIANVWWEATRFPPPWVDVLSRFDGVLVMSHFIAEVCRNNLAMTPTLYGEYPLELPQNIHKDRQKFGFPESAIIFVASLDPNSDPIRKNPAAIINTFRTAFPATDDDARLVIRLNNVATKMGQQVVQHLLKLAQGDDRIRLLLEPMSYEQVLCFYASADVYLSFHRGEGLGLGMLESMRLGKPVIATGWSGNLSFMNSSNSALLRYRLIPVSGSYNFLRPEMLGPDARWADPVLEDAVAWMRRLRHDPDLRETMGAKAKASVFEYQQRASEANWLSELNDLWQAQQHLPGVVEKFSFDTRSREKKKSEAE